MATGDLMFQIGPIFIGIIFIIVVGGILISILKSVSQWSKNNNSPVLDVEAKVVGKRTATRGGGETRAYSTYFVTFEFTSGDRQELSVKDVDYGMLVEGDLGELKFQGTRFLHFTRKGSVKG
jgi:hypothetical protein